MNEIRRLTPNKDCISGMLPNDDGNYVSYTDHLAALRAIGAQNEWLMDRIAYLEPSAHLARHREEWLIDCGMPTREVK